MNANEYRLAKEAGVPTTERLSELLNIAREHQESGRVPRELCYEVADALNRERSSVGEWQVTPVGRGMRVSLRLPFRK